MKFKYSKTVTVSCHTICHVNITFFLAHDYRLFIIPGHHMAKPVIVSMYFPNPLSSPGKALWDMRVPLIDNT